MQHLFDRGDHLWRKLFGLNGISTGTKPVLVIYHAIECRPADARIAVGEKFFQFIESTGRSQSLRSLDADHIAGMINILEYLFSRYGIQVLRRIVISTTEFPEWDMNWFGFTVVAVFRIVFCRKKGQVSLCAPESLGQRKGFGIFRARGTGNTQFFKRCSVGQGHSSAGTDIIEAGDSCHPHRPGGPTT